jgi:hypothetical protein
VGAFSKLFSSSTPDERFWQWFTNNLREFENIRTGEERICSELAKQLKRIDRHLTFVFGINENEKLREFIVSADGIRSSFPAVKKLVAAAPEIQGWKITAFRPPSEALGTLTIGNVTVGPDDIWFSARRTQELVELVVYIRNAEQLPQNAIGQLAFIYLDHCLGEYDVETKIGSIDFRPLPDNPESFGLQPVSKLVETVRQLTTQ